jgi:MFS family permease
MKMRACQTGLTLAIAAYFLSFFHRVAPAAISGELTAAFDIGAASLGTLAATYFIIYTLMQIPTGILADTLGPRKILFVGGLVAGGGSLLFGLASSFELAFVGRALVGLGVSVTFIAMLKLIAVWFEESRFATLTGVCMLVGNLGSILAGAPLAWAAQLTSWRDIFVGTGMLSLAIGIASLFLVSDGPQPQNRKPGLPVDRTAWLSGLLQVLGNRATWPGFFVNLGMAASFFSFAGLWAVPYFTQALGMTRATAANHVSLYFLGYAVGALLLGSLSDRLGRRKPLLVGGSLLHAAGWLVWLAQIPLSPVASYALCAAMGLATASFTLTWACAKEANPPLLSGMATSVVNVGVFLGPAILQPLTGWIIDRSWQASHGVMADGARLYSAVDFRAGLLLMSAAAFGGFLATLYIKETGNRNIWKESPP